MNTGDPSDLQTAGMGQRENVHLYALTCKADASVNKTGRNWVRIETIIDVKHLEIIFFIDQQQLGRF